MIQKVLLKGVDSFTMQQLAGISLVLVALGAILRVCMRERRYDKPLIPAAEAADSVPVARPGREGANPSQG